MFLGHLWFKFLCYLCLFIHFIYAFYLFFIAWILNLFPSSLFFKFQVYLHLIIIIIQNICVGITGAESWLLSGEGITALSHLLCLFNELKLLMHIFPVCLIWIGVSYWGSHLIGRCSILDVKDSKFSEFAKTRFRHKRRCRGSYLW